MKPNPYTLAIAAGGVGVLLLALLIWKKGGIAGAAKSIGAGAVDAAGGVVSGGVGAIGATVGLPTPDETTTDPAVVRWIIDTHGYLTASKWAGAVALAKAAFMDAGSGTPPPAGSTLARALPAPEATYTTMPTGQAYAPTWADVSGQSFADLAKPGSTLGTYTGAGWIQPGF